VSSGAACDHWSRPSTDLLLASDLGLNSYRFSIEWAKIEPEEGVWDESALDWYCALLDSCEAQGLLPMATLHHFTLPQWLAAKGGFSNPESVGKFSRYAKKVVERMGGRIPLWCTFNEPMVLLLGSYVGRFMPPALFAPELFARGCENILKAHLECYEAIHGLIKTRSGPWKDQPLQVGVAHNMLDFLPDHWWHPLEQILSFTIRRFYNRSWLNALTGQRQHFGVPFILPSAKTVKEARGKQWLDFLGVNYYTKAYVKWRPKDSGKEALPQMPVGISFARRKEEQSDLGWAVHPRGFERVLQEAAAYGLPIYVTENGLADREDRIRSSYLLSHLQALAKVAKHGLDLRGYYYWSLLDNFEWVEGFGPRFGLYHVDYQTFVRSPRPAAHLYKRIVQAHQKTLPPSGEILENFQLP
jgi:beta-glucosidase